MRCPPLLSVPLVTTAYHPPQSFHLFEPSPLPHLPLASFTPSPSFLLAAPHTPSERSPLPPPALLALLPSHSLLFHAKGHSRLRRSFLAGVSPPCRVLPTLPAHYPSYGRSTRAAASLPTRLSHPHRLPALVSSPRPSRPLHAPPTTSLQSWPSLW
ncbi:hypothetical protein EDB89DRAFT_1967646 [Lactarius sanguifluus]|nr:hypothetical protein EDB89DRAFT_1967646 [Lactarius sanguifluus]